MSCELMKVLTSAPLCLVVLVASAKPAPADESLQVLPATVELGGTSTQARVLLHREQAGVLAQQCIEDVSWSVVDESVAQVSSRGVITPGRPGETELIARLNGQEARATVRVSAGSAENWSFAEDILPILTKAGCNMGACHGALAGKGGFRLSLRGYDPETDFFNIVKQDRGRRVDFVQPGRSLLLAKPSGGLPHKGGLRLDSDSDDYRRIAEWIAAGAAPPVSGEPSVVSVTAYPERVQLAAGDRQQLIAYAAFSDGRVRDVTPWVKWTSANEAVCQVDEEGRVNVVGPGEGAVSAWYASQLSLARITVPFSPTSEQDLWADLPARNFIDTEINRQLARLRIPASPPCSDQTFIRRVHLDATGLPPTAQQVRDFLADTSADKRDKLIDALLASPEFVDYWTYRWSDVLMINGQLLRPDAVKAYYKWIRQQVEANTPWDQFVTEVLTATGGSVENGATNFYALFQTPEDMTENASQAFLGLSLGCAKCHNHPLEKWTNDQYYAMANLFSRVRAKGWGGEPRSGDGRRTLIVAEAGELVQPRTGQPQPPTPLDGESIAFDDPGDRRVHLARWMTAPENPYFSRAIVNRVWANYFGVGLVESVDDLRTSNPASNEELLQQAAGFLVAQKFDLRVLMREIMQSHAYQRSSDPVAGNAADTRFYSRYFPRRLDAEVLHDALVQATGAPTRFEQIAFPGADMQATDFYPLGTRAIQLYDSAVDSYFLKTFGRNQRNIVCECERSNEPSMVQVLHLSNGGTMNEKLAAATGHVSTQLAQWRSGMSCESLVDEAYLQCLSRYPSDAERAALTSVLRAAAPEDQRSVLEDVYWALLTSREFVFRH